MFPALRPMNAIVLKTPVSTRSHPAFTLTTTRRHSSFTLVSIAVQREVGTTYTYSNKFLSETSSPRRQIALELPGEALRRHFQFFILRPFDIDDRPMRGTDAPRRERDAVCAVRLRRNVTK